MVIKPWGSRVLLERLNRESRVVIPDQAKEISLQGLVLAVGPGKRLVDGSREEMVVHPGDVVGFTRWPDYGADGRLVIVQQDDIAYVVVPGKYGAKRTRRNSAQRDSRQL